ncbi:MAG: hypothetical protein O6945_06200 [Gammaproteobacteria bacterium]|nr:hypothetical protein [Gammaproteobacteria bacterium]
MQVSQDAVDHVLLLDAGDDRGSSTAAATDLDVDIEDAFVVLRAGEEQAGDRNKTTAMSEAHRREAGTGRNDP